MNSICPTRSTVTVTVAVAVLALASLAPASHAFQYEFGPSVDLLPTVGQVSGVATQFDDVSGHLWIGGRVNNVSNFIEWDVTSNAVVSSFPAGDYHILALDPITRDLYLFDAVPPLKAAVHDQTGQLVQPLATPARITAACFDAGGALYVLPLNLSPTQSNPIEVQELDRNTGVVLRTMPLPELPTDFNTYYRELAYDPISGNLVLYADGEKRLYELDVQTGRIVDYHEEPALGGFQDWSWEIGYDTTGQRLFRRSYFGSQTHILQVCPLNESTPIHYCVGDTVTQICPCGNDALEGTLGEQGCMNSTGTEGGFLRTSGTGSLSDQDLQLRTYGMNPASLGIFFSGTSDLAPLAFGDGLRCVGGQLRRLEVAPPTGGIVSTSVNLALVDGVQAGDWRYYQYWYRDPAGPCGSGFNSTNAAQVRWQ